MLIWIRKFVHPQFIAFAVMVALVLTNFGIAIAHHPASEEAGIAHQADATAQVSGHGHHHKSDTTDKDSERGKPAGHLAGHNAADHSHVPAGNLTSSNMSLWHHEGRDWLSQPLVFVVPKASFKLDRPPKSAFLA